MAVQRYDLNACIGCQNCITVCPMDVFRFDYEQNKSVIAYPENCQSCGQCFVGCQGRSLRISWYEQRFGITAARAVATDSANEENVNQAIIDQPAKAAAEAEASSSSWSSSSSS